MNAQHLTAEQQALFDTFFDSVLRLLGAGFEGKRDTFMIAPLRYTQSTIFPTDKTMSRNQLRTRIEYALVRAGDTISTEGKGVYMVDRYVVNNSTLPNPEHFVIQLCNARRGGRVITFSLG